MFPHPIRPRYYSANGRFADDREEAGGAVLQQSLLAFLSYLEPVPPLSGWQSRVTLGDQSVGVLFGLEQAKDQLGFEGANLRRVPLFLIVVLFELSMDYQIFVVSRIREAVLRGVPSRRAIYDGIASSASAVISAAVVMVTVFVAYIFLHLLEMKQIGFSLAIGVLIDAGGHPDRGAAIDHEAAREMELVAVQSVPYGSQPATGHGANRTASLSR